MTTGVGIALSTDVCPHHAFLLMLTNNCQIMIITSFWSRSWSQLLAGRLTVLPAEEIMTRSSSVFPIRQYSKSKFLRISDQC